jgi:hypothetical protein
MPLIQGSSQKIIGQNISELHGGRTYQKTKKKFGKKKANAQAIAIAEDEARKSKRKGRLFGSR